MIQPPILTGSEKQVAWAKEIRARLIATLESDAAEAEASGSKVRITITAKFRQAIPVLLWERRAVKWIEHRADQSTQLVDWAEQLELLGEASLRRLA
jgi:hypothetical protein